LVRRRIAVAEENDGILEHLSERVQHAGMTVAVAESLTGGGLSAELARAPGSSTWYRGGIVAYASEVKYELLDVPRGPVVSEPAACAMAEGAARLLGADVTISVTGVGGPEEQDGQPPGTVWMALHDRETTRSSRAEFKGEPPEIVASTIRAALLWLHQRVENDD
jgi:nicotinamide-nucleotide amidase